MLGRLLLLFGIVVPIEALAAEPPSWEAGPVFSLTSFGTGALSTGRAKGASGGRFAVNVHPNFGIEYQMAVFPDGSDRTDIQGSGHVKFTYRAEQAHKINFFAIAGPGFFHERGYGLRGVRRSETSVSFNYGSGLEMIPHRRYLIRLDLADFFVRRKDLLFPRFFTRWGHQLDFKAAVMFRF